MTWIRLIRHSAITFCLVLMAVISFTVHSACAEPGAASAAEPAIKPQTKGPFAGRIKIGVSLPLSGPYADVGNQIQSILMFALKKYGGNRYSLAIENDQCEEGPAAAAAKRLVEMHKVSVVIGFACSESALGAAPILEEARIPTMIVYASSAKLKNAGEFIFRTWPSDIAAATTLYQYAARHDHGIALFTEQSPVASEFSDLFQAANIRGNVEMRTEEFFPGTTDFRNMIVRTKAWSPDAVFISSQNERGFANALRQLREYKWKGAIYGAYWPGSPALQKDVKELLNGVIFVNAPPLTLLIRNDGWPARYEYNRPLLEPEAVFGSTIEAFRALDAAINSGKDVRDYLYNSRFTGVIGDYSFDRNGEIVGFNPLVQEIRNGKPEPVKQ